MFGNILEGYCWCFCNRFDIILFYNGFILLMYCSNSTVTVTVINFFKLKRRISWVTEIFIVCIGTFELSVLLGAHIVEK